jgi:hypothetical protein
MTMMVLFVLGCTHHSPTLADTTSLLGTWSETWGASGEQTDVTYNDQYIVTWDDGWQVRSEDRPEYRFSKVDLVNRHLRATLLNESDSGDLYVIDYELDLIAPGRLTGGATTNHGVDTSIAWDRVN